MIGVAKTSSASREGRFIRHDTAVIGVAVESSTAGGWRCDGAIHDKKEMAVRCCHNDSEMPLQGGVWRCDAGEHVGCGVMC